MITLLMHDLTLYLKNIKEAIYLYVYFVAIITFFIFGFSAESGREYAAAILFVALITSLLLAAPLLFEREAEEGRLDYLRLLPLSLELVVIARYLACYLVFVLPILALVPPAGMLLQIAPSAWAGVTLLLALAGALILALIVMASAMTAGLNNHAGLIGLMVLPLMIPLVIFGVGAMQMIILTTADHDSGQIVFLAALTFFILPLTLFVSAACLRVSG